MKSKKSHEEITAETTEAAERLARELGLTTTVKEATEAVMTITGHAHTVHAVAGRGLSSGLSRSSSSFEEGIEKLVTDIVRKVLEDEKVLVDFAGKVKRFNRESISTSKLDPKVADVKITEPKKEEKAPDFMEELSKLR